MSKIFYIDVETTGVNPERNALVQIAGIIEIEGEEKEKIDLLMAPFVGDKVEQEALNVIGKTEKEIWEHPAPKSVYSDFIKTMDKYVDRYSRDDKFHFVGYNSRFDDSFIRSLFKKCNDKYYGSWFHWPAIDVANLAAIRFLDSRDELPNFKLMTVAKKLGIDVDEEKAHDAFYDINITKKMFQILK